jgi:hypothetical protein
MPDEKPYYLRRYEVYLDSATPEKPFVVVCFRSPMGGDVGSRDYYVIGRSESYGLADYWKHQLNTGQKDEDYVCVQLNKEKVG